jgi:predicted porin
MQKKLIALAVAGLVAAPAFAQSTVTIYGTLDYGYVRLNDNSNEDIGNRNAIESGVSKANRIGFKVVEDLGNGLKVVGVLENSIQGERTGAAGFLNGVDRQSYAALAGGFGTIAFGRHYTPQHLFISAVDPFGQNGLGAAGNVVNHTKRLSNLAAYISPNWGGFSFIAAYTFNGLDSDEAPGNNSQPATDLNAKVWAIAPSFTVGGLFVGLNYHRADLKGRYATLKNEKLFDNAGVYVSYDFGPVKIGGLYDQTTFAKNFSGTNDKEKDKSWLVGLTVPFTASDKLLASYGQAKYDGDKIKQWAVGYEHSLSKRTALYAQYAAQNDKFKNIDAPYYDGGLDDKRSTGVSTAYRGGNASGAAGYQKGFAVGIRHDF